MAKKSLGRTTLYWICSHCDTRNPGPKKTCTTCGTPQPDDVEFIQGDLEEITKINDAISLKADRADIHCPFCGTRNPADAEFCSQCNGKLTGGTKRAAGRVVGVHKGGSAQGIVCPTCGFQNKPNAPRCAQCGNALVQKKSDDKSPRDSGQSKTIWIAVGLVAAIILGFLLFKGCSRSTETGVVSRSTWTRSVAVEQFIPISAEGWWDEIPSEAFVTVCEDRFRYSSDEAVEGAVEVCGEPYTIDEGTGYGEVVQDCEYQVFDTYCEYEISDWEVVEILQSEGYGLSAQWPMVGTFSEQRPGERTETYTIWFETPDGTVEFTTDDFGLYQAAESGSDWVLSYDGFGNILSAKPN